MTEPYPAGPPNQPEATAEAPPAEVNPPAIQEEVALEPETPPDFSPGPWSYQR